MSILKKAPDGAEVFDLGAARVARAEARKGRPGPVLKLSAGFVELKPELDVLTAEDFNAGHIRDGLTKLLADPTDIDELMREGLTKTDLEQIVQFATGSTSGE